MKNAVIVALVALILILVFRRMSFADQMSPSPSNCGSKTILKTANCNDIYPGVYTKDGPVVGDRKYCCA
jgi:hypothetical protein